MKDSASCMAHDSVTLRVCCRLIRHCMSIGTGMRVAQDIRVTLANSCCILGISLSHHLRRSLLIFHPVSTTLQSTTVTLLEIQLSYTSIQYHCNITGRFTLLTGFG